MILTQNQKELLVKTENFEYFTKLIKKKIAGGLLSENLPFDFNNDLNSLLKLFYIFDCPHCGSIVCIEEFKKKIRCDCGRELRIQDSDFEIRYDLDDFYYEEILQFFEQNYDYEDFKYRFIFGEREKLFLDHTGILYIHITFSDIWGKEFHLLDELYLDHYSIDWLNFIYLFDTDKRNLLFKFILNYREVVKTKQLRSGAGKDYFLREEVINILHLSDFHFSGNRSDIEKKFLITNLIKDLKDFLSGKNKVDFVIISGDVTDTAQIEQFKKVNEYLITIFEDPDNGLGIDKERCYVVPGNHDINWEQFDQNLYNELTSKYNETYLNKLWYDPNYTDKLRTHFKKLENFRWFQENILNVEPLKYDKLYTCTVYTKNDFSIGFIGLNTAWSGGCKDENGKLLMSKHQVFEAIADLNEMRECDINIAFYHHPLENLNNEEIEIIKPLLYNKFLLIMFGHQHNTGYEFIEGFDTPTHLIRAGPIYKTDEKIRGTYNLIQINTSKKVGRIIYRKPHKTNIENFNYDWEASPLIKNKDKNGVFSFEIE